MEKEPEEGRVLGDEEVQQMFDTIESELLFQVMTKDTLMWYGYQHPGEGWSSHETITDL